MLGKGHGGLYSASTKEERRKRKAKRRERDQIKSIDLGFERCQVVRFKKAVAASKYALKLLAQNISKLVQDISNYLHHTSNDSKCCTIFFQERKRVIKEDKLAKRD